MPSAYFLSSLAEALFRERFASPAAIQRVQQRRLRRLLRHAARHSPFNSGRIRRAAAAFDQLQQIRPVDVREMMDSFSDTVCGERITLAEARDAAQSKPGKVARVRDRWMVSQTSGTTGEPGYFLNDHGGLAGDEPGHMPRNETRVGLVCAAAADHDADHLAGEVRFLRARLRGKARRESAGTRASGACTRGSGRCRAPRPRARRRAARSARARARAGSSPPRPRRRTA